MRSTSISKAAFVFAASLACGVYGLTGEIDTNDARNGNAMRHRELAEQDNLKRLRLDEFYLPQLDVSLPVLFKWSDAERIYLAHGEAHAIDRYPWRLTDLRGASRQLERGRFTAMSEA
ncbi:MAG TPA: hypothetical protein VIL28_00715 [Steroidobacteraceae bacterium]|mgnify:CR=1 FL=1